MLLRVTTISYLLSNHLLLREPSLVPLKIFLEGLISEQLWLESRQWQVSREHQYTEDYV